MSFFSHLQDAASKYRVINSTFLFSLEHYHLSLNAIHTVMLIKTPYFCQGRALVDPCMCGEKVPYWYLEHITVLYCYYNQISGKIEKYFSNAEITHP